MKTTEDICRRVFSSEIGVAANDIKPGSKIIDDLGMDSLDAVELIIALEDEFGFNIPEVDSGKWITFGDAVNYIEKMRAL